MITGEGHPVINIGNTSIDLPKLKRGKRIKERQEPETFEWTNPRGINMKGKPKYRFYGEYDFMWISQAIYRQITNLLNAYGSRCLWMPYNDLEQIHFNCHAEWWPYNVRGNVDEKGMRINVTQIDTSPIKYTEDSIITIGAETPIIV